MIHSCLVCVCVCVYMCKHVSLRVSVFESLSAYLYVCIFHIFNNLLYSIPCLSLATKTLTSSHFLILTSTHNEHIHMISSNILMNIFMQVFGVCKSYNYITHLSTYTPTRSRANHRLVFWANFETKTTGFDGLRRASTGFDASGEVAAVGIHRSAICRDGSDLDPKTRQGRCCPLAPWDWGHMGLGPQDPTRGYLGPSGLTWAQIWYDMVRPPLFRQVDDQLPEMAWGFDCDFHNDLWSCALPPEAESLLDRSFSLQDMIRASAKKNTCAYMHLETYHCCWVIFSGVTSWFFIGIPVCLVFLSHFG